MRAVFADNHFEQARLDCSEGAVEVKDQEKDK